MTEHPAKAAGCTPSQIRIFEQICIGIHNPRCKDKTLKALVDKGLVGVEMRLVGRDRFGEIRLPYYYVEMGSPIHMQWCQWASERPFAELDEPVLPACNGR